MTVQHKDIIDAQRHGVKGASTATAGQALFALGDDETEFREIDFSDIGGTPSFSLSLVEELNALSTTDQTVTVANTPLQISFGAAQTVDNIDLDATGNVTFLTDGTYTLKIEMAACKTGGSSATRLFFRELYDGVEVDKASCVRFKGTETDAQKPVYFETIIEATAGKVYSLWIASDTGDTIGLISDAFTVTGWGHTDTHSVHLRIYRFGV